MNLKATPINPFKAALRERQAQIGLWLGLAHAVSAEICATAGFDWLLIDGEHAPNGLTDVLAQLQAIAAYPDSHAIVRVPVLDVALLKQTLDLGAQTVLIPMVDTPEQAALAVRACRYPQDDGQGGIRGMAGARGSRWGLYPHYAQEANEQVCVLVQAETRTAMANLDAIAATPGVDGVFIGPADLSASLGHVGNPHHPEVQAAIADGVSRILAAGKAPGILTSDTAQAQQYLTMGVAFVAVGLDTSILARHTRDLMRQFRAAELASSVSSRLATY